MQVLTRAQIEEALARLDAVLGRSGIHAELFLVGGAVMCLALDARNSTRDVDGWFTEPQAVRAAAREVAAEMQLPEDWLNDAARPSFRPVAHSSGGARSPTWTFPWPTTGRCSP
jgi:hypothetical protein